MFRNEDGQTIVEYALITVGISLVMVVVLIGFGSGILDAASVVIDTFL